MVEEKCQWHNKCQNGSNGCWTLEPENCVRFMPIDGENLTEVNVIVGTQPGIDSDKFNQYFVSWIHSMGWNVCGSVRPYAEGE